MNTLAKIEAVCIVLILALGIDMAVRIGAIRATLFFLLVAILIISRSLQQKGKSNDTK